MHDGLLLHALPPLLLLRLLPHELHAQPDARRHGGQRHRLPAGGGGGSVTRASSSGHWVLGRGPGPGEGDLAAQKGEGICPGSPSKTGAELRLEPEFPGSWARNGHPLFLAYGC